MQFPFFSIITATYNAASTLPQLLESLASQTCKDFELVVQDGASKDNTVAIIEQYRGKIPNISFASEPDTGIYDAWNKALKRIQGQWVIILGADDRLASPDVLHEVQHFLLSQAKDTLFLSGDVQMQSICGTWSTVSITKVKAGEREQKERMPAPFPSLFIHQSLLKDNPFSTNFKICGDYDFLCRKWNAQQAVPFEKIVTVMGAGGISSNPRTLFKAELEYARIAAQYYPNIWTAQRIGQLAATFCISFLYTVFSEKTAATLLDFQRTLRRLPPKYGNGVK